MIEYLLMKIRIIVFIELTLFGIIGRKYKYVINKIDLIKDIPDLSFIANYIIWHI